MPVHFPIINTRFVKPLTGNTSLKISKTALPVVLTPIAAYYMGETRDRKATEVIQFFKDNNLELPRVIKPGPDGTGLSAETKLDLNTRLSNGVKDGTITTDDEIKGRNLVAFTGKPPEENVISMQDLAKNPDMIKNMTPEDILNIDTSLPPELETFAETSLDNIPDGLMENIADAIPAGFSVDNDMLSIARGWLASITDGLEI